MRQREPCAEISRRLILAKVFLWIGITGFGGALATMTLMEQEWVSRRKLLTHEQFLEGMALWYLLPGPTAVLLSIYLGSRLRGILGGIIIGLAFIMPAVLLTLLLSWAYFQYHTIPAVYALFVGLGPVVVALILCITEELSPKLMEFQFSRQVPQALYAEEWRKTFKE